MRSPRHLGLALSVLVIAMGVSACGGDDGDDGAGDGGEPKAPVIIEIVEDGGKITPDDAHVVKVDTGQEITLNVSSDVDDEIHVHSTPEHEFEVTAGEDETFTFTIDTPGTVAVESHGLEVTLVKLQVE